MAEHRRGEPADQDESWPVHDSEVLFRDEWVIGLRRDVVSRPGHEDEEGTFPRLVLEHPGAVMVLAVDEEDRVLVLEQYRHPVRRRLLELPAGLRDSEGEEPLDTAQRELLEEAGLAAASWEHLLTSHPSPGISSETLEVFLARDLSAADRGDFTAVHEEADMTVRWVPVHDLATAVLQSRATDGPLALAVLAYVYRATAYTRCAPRGRGGSHSGGECAP
jgi:8-oxo-dGTP pyrophosphatase MutT (NUDIX family)